VIVVFALNDQILEYCPCPPYGGQGLFAHCISACRIDDADYDVGRNALLVTTLSLTTIYSTL